MDERAISDGWDLDPADWEGYRALDPDPGMPDGTLTDDEKAIAAHTMRDADFLAEMTRGVSSDVRRPGAGGIGG